MIIAISAAGPNLESRIGDRFGISPYLIILDTETMAFEAIPNPGASGEQGAGMKAVVLAVSREVEAVLTGYCSPVAERHLKTSGINVISNLTGTVREEVERYKLLGEKTLEQPLRVSKASQIVDGTVFAGALRNTLKQFVNMLPMLAGVVLLIGLFNALISKDSIAAIFSGHSVLDTLLGAGFGSLFAGNPVNSYVIGDELLNYDVSLYAVTAFILAWVSVGLVQLPAEIVALGRGFALSRNGLALIMTIPTAILTVAILELIEG